MNIQLMIAERQASIRHTVHLMADPVVQLPTPIRWAAWLTGTADYLQTFLRALMQKRVDRLQQECLTLSEIALLQGPLHADSDRP